MRPIPYTVRMDVYDFDGTLYDGDSTRDFLLWCARRYPGVLLTLPKTGVAAIRCYKLHTMEKTSFKRVLYRFLARVPYIEAELARFWEARSCRIGGPCNPQPDDLVISAGPEFLMHGVCKERGLVLIASQVDPHTGEVLGPNCSNDEKPRRFRKAYPNAEIDNFYSDSRNDDPLAAMAKRAFLVDIPSNTIKPWPIA